MKFAEVVIEALKRYPLLVLGFSLVVAAGTFSLGLAARKIEDPAVLYVTAAIFLAAMLIAAFLIIGRPSANVSDEEIDKSISTLLTAARYASTPDAEINSCIVKSVGATKAGLNREIDLLSSVIREEWKDFAAQIGFGAGDHVVSRSGEQYKRFLVNVYEIAKKNVFSTCVPDYMIEWDTSLGKEIMETHTKNAGNSKTVTTRVFIFHSEDELKKYRSIMLYQASVGVAVRYFMDNETNRAKFSQAARTFWKGDSPPRHNQDFTIVDSQVVGITTKFENNPAADWHFDPGTVERFQELRKALIENSITVDKPDAAIPN